MWLISTDPCNKTYTNLAKLTDYPTISADMKARRHWLRENRKTVQTMMDFNPEFYDTKIAAWWCYVVNNSILISGSVSLTSGRLC